ncbi:MAG: hypothetical protein DRO76_06180 [Candidatus Altiarchaeales archaeon]|nr:MAG: hypothetical protein DRO76_06180 [Candidatus Altiarchaeales archaeon]
MKEYHVAFINEKTKKAFEELKEGKFEDSKLYGFISRAIDDLKKDPLCGIRIPKKQIPREYIKKYKVDNLRKYNLPGAWRLVYTIKADEVMILSIILEWMDHKKYERKFGY